MNGCLLTELKLELDRVAEEFRDTNHRLAAIEASYNDRLKRIRKAHLARQERETRLRALQEEREAEEEALEIAGLFERYCGALERFNRVSASYRIAHTYCLDAVIRVNLRRLLMGGGSVGMRRPELAGSLARLARALKDFCRVSPDDGNDQRVRQAWRDVECLIGT